MSAARRTRAGGYRAGVAFALAWLVLVAAWAPARAQQAAPPVQASASARSAATVEAPAPRTGDAWVDARFADIDRYAQRYRAAFVDELVRYHATPRVYADALPARAGWSAGDAYYACALAAIVGRPCSEVVARRAAAPDAGWEPVAAALGAAPGSPAALQLKRGYVDSYARWARPLVPDAQLAREARRKPATRPARATRKPAR